MGLSSPTEGSGRPKAGDIKDGADLRGATFSQAIHPILATRGVQPEYVSGYWGRRYARFEQGDWQAFKAAGHTHHHGWMKRAFVDAGGGFVIHRADSSGVPLPSYIRPDLPVCTRHGRQAVGTAGSASKQVCLACGKELSKYTQASRACPAVRRT
jgi:hypothetical protein